MILQKDVENLINSQLHNGYSDIEKNIKIDQ